MKTRNVSILLNNEYHRLIIHHFLYKQVVRQKAFLMSALQMSPTWGGSCVLWLLFARPLASASLSLIFFTANVTYLYHPGWTSKCVQSNQHSAAASRSNT